MKTRLLAFIHSLVAVFVVSDVALAAFQDGFEPDDGWTQASPIWSGPAQPHTIYPIGDEDWVTFTLPRTCAVVIATSGPAGDTRMWLYDSGLNQIDYNDDIAPPSNLFSRIGRVCRTDPLPAGTYYVKIDEFNDDEVIDEYDLQVTVTACTLRDLYVDDDAPNDPGPGDPSVSDPLEDGTPEHPYDAIQEAINVSIGGDTVIVKDGTYSGSGNTDIDFAGGLGWGTRAITVRSENSADGTVIDCMGANRGFSFQNSEENNSVLRGLTIVGATEAGIHTYSASPSIEDCVLMGNGDHAIYAYAGAPVITGCHIEGNTGSYFAPGIYCYGAAAIITDCVIAHNQGGAYGAAVFFEDCWSGDPVIARCLIYGNSGTDYAGGIGCMWSDPLIENCVIARNFSGNKGGGLYIEVTSNPTIMNCNIVGNEAGVDGGGVYSTGGSDPLFKNTIIWHNYPNAIELGSDFPGPGNPVLDYCDVQGGWSGAGSNNIEADPDLLFFRERIDTPMMYWYLASDSPCIDAGTSTGAPATDKDGRPRYDDPATPDTGGGLPDYADIGVYEFKPYYVNNATGHDGYNGLHRKPGPGSNGPKQRIESALEAAAAGDQVIVAAGTYAGAGNRDLDSFGKDIVLRSEKGLRHTIIDCEGNASNEHRGIVFQSGESSKAVLKGFSIVNGYVAQTSSGGGIAMSWASPTILSCRITDCYGAYGGAIDCFRSSPAIIDCILSRNHALATLPASGDGGAIEIYYGDPLIKNCLIVNNTADRNGGGINCYAGVPRISSCTVYGNSATHYGGGIFVQDNPKVTDCIVWNNTPESIYNWGGTPDITYSDIDGGTGQSWFGVGCLDTSPYFAPGPLHNFYLCHTDLQGSQSPCVDAGSAPAGELGLEKRTTRTDGGMDGGMVDMGYHSPHLLKITAVYLLGDSLSIEWNARPGGNYTVEWSTNMEGWNPIYVGQTDAWTDTGGMPGAATCYRIGEE